MHIEEAMIDFETSDIPFSLADKRRKLKIPSTMSTDLAEEIGIYIGDGSMNIYDYKTRGRYWLEFSGNSSEETNYYKNHLSGILKNLYNIEGLLIKSKRDNSITLRIYSKAIVNFKLNVLGLPFGSEKARKSFIPRYLFSSKKILSSFLRGLADTDFTLTFKEKVQKLSLLSCY